MRRILIAVLALSACSSRPGPKADSAFAVEMLAAQNAARAAALPAPDPPLGPLTWSDEAAAVAQAWADRCDYRHNPGRGVFGENIGAAQPPGAFSNTDLIHLWTVEASDYDYAANTCAQGKQCGHYLQVVARDTTRVGCATATCHGSSPLSSTDPDWQYWVCDYEPPLITGDRPY